MPGKSDERAPGKMTRRKVLAGTGMALSAAPFAARGNTEALAAPPPDKRDVVLRDSEHIRTYYKLARS